MKVIISVDVSELEAIAAELDARLGYPFDGIDIGGGVHAPPEQSRTLRRADVIKHPSLNQWALPVDQDVADALLARADVTGPAPVDVVTPLGDALAADDLGPDWDQKSGPAT